MSELSAFFSAMKPLLRGQHDAARVEAALGPASPDTAALGFYAVLMERNACKAMRELYPAVPAAAERHRPGLWAELVHDFVRERPARGHHPDAVGEGFADWLAGRGAAGGGELPALLVELADFHTVQLRAATAPDPAPGDDGFDRTLFVRLYMHPIPAVAEALRQGGAGATLPDPSLTPLVVVRPRGGAEVRLLSADPATLVALARRAGTEVPDAFDRVPAAAVESALGKLVQRGILCD